MDAKLLTEITSYQDRLQRAHRNGDIEEIAYYTHKAEKLNKEAYGRGEPSRVSDPRGQLEIDHTKAMQRVRAEFEEQKAEPIPSQPTRKDPMANKFLPFIVEKSTPVHIYQTLLSRSKRMNVNTITSILHLIMTEGITKVRTHVKTMPDMSLDKIYEELVSTFSKCRIPNDELHLMLSMGHHIRQTDKELWSDELNEFNIADVLCFFTVMAKTGNLSAYTEMPFQKLLDVALRDDALNNINQFVDFEDQGVRRGFKSPADLKAFILYTAFLDSKDSEETPPICAYYLEEDNDNDSPF